MKIQQRVNLLCRAILVILIGSSINACNYSAKAPLQQAEQALLDKNAVTTGWWYARFRLDWPDQEPRWYLGTMLAAEVVAPVLITHNKKISLWRFHRRAHRESGGHIFSFIFYSAAADATAIYHDLLDNQVLKYLQNKEQVKWVGLDDTSKILRPNIKDTSDPRWPETIQKTWPNYLMGASQMWLDMVLDVAAKQGVISGDEVSYSRVQNKVTEIWQQQGRHVWLHHLNALFAYQPLLMRY